MRRNLRLMTRFLSVLLPVFLLYAQAHAGTIVLEGRINEKIAVTQERVFSTPSGGLSKLVFRFASPSESNGVTLSQTLSNHKIDYSPRPDSVTAEKDAYGNAFTTATWTNLKTDAVVKETFTAALDINLRGMKSAAPFPLPASGMPDDVKTYLKPTGQVQTEDPAINALAATLTRDAATEQAAVMAVLNWVVDNIKYKTPIPDYSATWTLKTGHGNCQNYAHLSIALLRSVGIPARIVGGIALGKQWKVPITGGALLQSIGQGGHAWMEVWYPDLGWVPFDAQQSHLFVGPRHIKQTAGLDSYDINDSWRAAPALPPFKEDISAEFLTDDVKLALVKESQSPVSYIMTGPIEAAAPAQTVKPVEPVKPVIEPPKPVIPAPPAYAAGPVEFGNLDFPALMDFVVTTDSKVGYKTFDKETSEYVTGGTTYTQAFTVETDMLLDTVSLAMHKFGGRLGSLWIDVVEDDNGHPGMQGVRSMPLSLDTVKYYPGYKWFDFRFANSRADQPILKKGRYWVILRRSKDAIVNWYYTPGNQYGVTGDARSTATGIDWSNVMNYDFNFKVKGEYLKSEGGV
ncbi:MAG: transglutaminase domain-containing protein [Deltaproteobacteria bacterium]|nr:transglutaminase domain-containing protein [Deltaproteobacteria bacterium]